MKNRLLPLFAMAFVAAGANAQTWTEPVEPTTGSELVSGHKYKIKNVEAGNCLAGGSSWYSWATSTILTEQEAAETFKLVYNENEDPIKTGWTIARPDGRFTFISGANPAGLEGLGEMHVDMAEQGHNYFDFVKQPNGYYRIRAIAADDTYGEGMDDYNNKWWGWERSEDAMYPTAVYATVTEDDYAVDWELIDMTEYQARVDLYNVLVESEDNTLVDNSAASDIYNSETATVEDILQAAADLKSAIAAAKAYEILEGASEEDPRDATSLIENADFSTGDISGWECTFVSGQTARNIGYQGASYNYEGVTIGGFIEAWANNADDMKRDGRTFATIGDAELQQVMHGLPAGKYRLTCDAIAVQQYERSENPVSGVELFATGGGLDMKTSLHTEDGKPEHYELIFINGAQGDVTLGLRTRNATANWIAADNFTLTYYGPISKDPQLVVLETYIAEVEAKYPDIEDVKAANDVKDEYVAALEVAKAASENYEEAKAAFEEVVNKLNASVAEYQKLASEMESIEQKMSQLEEQFPDLAGELADYHDQLANKYEEGTAETADIESIEETVLDMISTYISNHCEPGTDVTILLNNPAFDKNFSGWSTTGATPAWGGTNANPLGTFEGNREGMSSGNAEVYHNAFDMFQTIKNMPRGLFEVTVKAFERDDNGAGIEAELYAVLPDGSEQTQKVMNIQDDASEEMLFSDGTWWDDQPSGPNGWYIPNGMPGANTYFAAGHYENKVNIVMTEAGDLKIGLRTKSTGDWVLWDDFRIVYKGSGVAVYEEAMQELITKAGTLGDYGVMSAEAEQYIADAIDAGEKSLEGTDEDAVLAAMNDLKDAIAFGQASQKLVERLQSDYDGMSEYLMAEIESSEETFPEYIDMVGAKLEEGTFDTDAEIQGYITGLKEGFTKYVQYDYLDATEAAPADITPVIYNPRAVDPITMEASANGWTTNTGVGLDGVSFEQYNNEESDFSQVIYGLAPGYYRVKVQGFYRAGFPADVADSLNAGVALRNNVKLYANETSTNFNSIMAGNKIYNENSTEGADVTIDGEAYKLINSMGQFAQAVEMYDEDGETPLYENVLQFQVAEGQKETKIGLTRIGHLEGDWLIFTNWRLEYVGTATPEVDPTTAVKGVEISTSTRTQYFSVDGTQLSHMQKGINIVKTTLSDGSVRIQKVLVR